VIKAAIEVFSQNVAIKVSPAGGYNDMGYVFHSVVMGRLIDLPGTKDATSGDSRYVQIFLVRGR